MALLLFPLVAHLAAVAYLVGWLIRQVWAIFLWVRDLRRQRRIVFSLKAWNKVGECKDCLIYLAGALFGGVAAFWLVEVFIREWLLVIMVILALLSEEMRISPKQIQILEVMTFFNRLAGHYKKNMDLFETLAKVIQELPEGDMQKAVRETVLRRRSGDSFEGSLKAMRGIDPLLDEFVLTLLLSGWQNGPGLNIITDRLNVRAGRKWDCTSWNLLIKDKCRNNLQFSRGALIAALWVILISSFSTLTPVMPDRGVVVLVVLALFGLGFIFYLILTRYWLRRFLAISIFIIGLAAYANSLIVPIPSWIQFETISHPSDRTVNISISTSQIGTVYQELPASFVPAGLNEPPIAKTATPTVVVTTILNQPASIFTAVIPKEFDPCCHQSQQPR